MTVVSGEVPARPCATMHRMEPVKQLNIPSVPEHEVVEHEALLEDVAADARREPQRFLDDSRVPEGGE